MISQNETRGFSTEIEWWRKRDGAIISDKSNFKRIDESYSFSWISHPAIERTGNSFALTVEKKWDLEKRDSRTSYYDSL